MPKDTVPQNIPSANTQGASQSPKPLGFAGFGLCGSHVIRTVVGDPNTNSQRPGSSPRR